MKLWNRLFFLFFYSFAPKAHLAPKSRDEKICLTMFRSFFKFFFIKIDFFSSVFLSPFFLSISFCAIPMQILFQMCIFHLLSGCSSRMEFFQQFVISFFSSFKQQMHRLSLFWLRCNSTQWLFRWNERTLFVSLGTYKHKSLFIVLNAIWGVIYCSDRRLLHYFVQIIPKKMDFFSFLFHFSSKDTKHILASNDEDFLNRHKSGWIEANK